MSQEAKYQVLERIDAGGMAEVFKANSTSMQGFQKLVAIKRILPELTKKPRFIRMFLDEAKVSLHLNHNNCVQIFDLGRAGDTYFIVMEFVDGTNLKRMIENLHAQRRMMPVEQAAYIAIEICKGLEHAHKKKDLDGQPLEIVHRDISPPNVLISIEGEVKITDFGLAKAQSQVEVTDPGVVKGKFGYLSPEAAEGEPIDLRTDIFAVGILLWEMLVGERLFLGKTDYETLGLVQRAKFKPLSNYRSDVPNQLEQIIEKALVRDPTRRYQTARDLVEDLSRFLFSYGRPVTTFDIANQVIDVRTKNTIGSSVRDSGVQAAVQKEINKMVFLEQVDDLDAYLAEHYMSMSSRDDIPVANHSGSFEDPSQWADFGLGPQESFSGEATANGGEGWQESDLGLLLSENSGPVPALNPLALNGQMDNEFGDDATQQMSRESFASIEVDRMRRETEEAKRAAQSVSKTPQYDAPSSALNTPPIEQTMPFAPEQPPVRVNPVPHVPEPFPSSAQQVAQVAQIPQQQQQFGAMDLPPAPLEPASKEGGSKTGLFVGLGLVFLLLIAAAAVFYFQSIPA